MICTGASVDRKGIIGDFPGTGLLRHPMSDGIFNHFVHPDVAEDYDRHRPRFHRDVLLRIQQRLSPDQYWPRALDAGCGTGHSSVALREFASEVVATDISAAMLAQAPARPGIRYVQSPAEQLPFDAGAFPLITVSMAMHWFDRPRFLAEASRVLSPGGWLALYGYQFTRRVPGLPAVETWFRERYLVRYPATLRNAAQETPAELETHGLRWRERTEYLETRPYSAAAFAHSLLTHSNVIRVIESGAETHAAAETWLTNELTNLFGKESREVEFSGWYTLIQKQ